MLKSNLEESNEANAVLISEFPQQEDIKLYSQLPDYDDFRGYDLGIDEQLEKSDTLIYANFRKHPWQTSKRHLFTAKVPQKLFREIKISPENDKKDEFKQERMFGRVSKIPIANTSNELVEMDFVEYGDHATFLRIHDAFSRFSVVVF